MRILYILLLTVLSYSLRAQAVFADPSLGQVFITSGEDMPVAPPPVLSQNGTYKLKLPIYNLNTGSPIPAGTTKIKIGLGSKMILDPAFNLLTTNTSAYFTWTVETSGGQVQLTGDQIAPIPANFSDTAVFLVQGVILGGSTITNNFLVTNHAGGVITLSDENGANNLSAQAYFITQTVPVNFTDFQVRNQNCAVAVNFATENEVNLSRYLIEYATDGINFLTAGELLPRGNGQYSFTFNPPAAVQGAVIYIRVKSVDLDGRFQYTPIKALRDLCNDRSAIRLYPNPVNDNQQFVTIANTGALFNGNYSVSVIDLAGRQIEAVRLQLVNTNSFKYNTIRLAAGSYTLKIESGNSGEAPVVLQFQKMN